MIFFNNKHQYKITSFYGENLILVSTTLLSKLYFAIFWWIYHILADVGFLFFFSLFKFCNMENLYLEKGEF